MAQAGQGGRKGHGAHVGSEHEDKCQRVCENRRAALSVSCMFCVKKQLHVVRAWTWSNLGNQPDLSFPLCKWQ